MAERVQVLWMLQSRSENHAMYCQGKVSAGRIRNMTNWLICNAFSPFDKRAEAFNSGVAKHSDEVAAAFYMKDCGDVLAPATGRIILPEDIPPAALWRCII